MFRNRLVCAGSLHKMDDVNAYGKFFVRLRISYSKLIMEFYKIWYWTSTRMFGEFNID
jgi:hypothetical protein